MKDYYKILEVDKSATQKDVKKSFRKLAIKFHPDKNPGDESAATKMIEINEAYAVIGNDKLRKEYDNLLAGQNRNTNNGKYPYNSAYEDQRRADQRKSGSGFYDGYVFEGFEDFLNRSWESISGGFDDLFGVKTSSEDLFSEIYLSQQEALHGCRKMFVFEKPILCTSCFGNSIHNEFINCNECLNHGKQLLERKIWITIPKMTPNHGRIRLREEGIGSENSRPGDLILTIIVTPDGREPENTELNENITVEIDLEKAIHGGPLVVQAPTGKLRIQIPKEVHPGKIIRVRNEGFVNPQNYKRGHLYVQFQVKFPTDPTRTQQMYMDRLQQKSS